MLNDMAFSKTTLSITTLFWKPRCYFEKTLSKDGDICLFKHLSKTFDRFGKMLTRW